jgi:Tol biopolymer transport system component
MNDERMRNALGATLVGLALAVSGTAAAGQISFDGDGHAETPTWSLDGKYLSFEVNRFAGSIDMFMVPIQGEVAAKAPMKLSLPGSGGGPYGGGGGAVVVNSTWHPDRIVVFEGSNQGGDYRLYYAQTTAGNAAEMIPTTQLSGNLTFPAVSPNGMVMGFISNSTGNGDVYTRDTVSGNVAQLTDTRETEAFPQFRKDGKALLFTRKQSGSEDVFLVNVDTEAVTTIASGAGDQTRPNFAGEHVVYFDGARGEGTWDLAVASASGGDQKILARDVRLPTRARPAVSADGQWVAYSHADPTKDNKIVLQRVDGSKTVEVSTSHKACGDPALTSSGGRVLLAYTALPDSGADWRKLHVVDVTDKM